QRVAISNLISEDEIFPPADPCRHPHQVQPRVPGEKVWDDSCLTANYSHSGLFCSFYQPDGDLVDNTAIVFGHGEVVEETDGFGACADQIIRAHRDTIYPDGVVLAHHLSNDDLGPDV